ncbi:MAG: hypothetical protein WCA95_15465 [Opitutaceae bacterium]|jgi:hypothetical protein
MKPKIIKNDAEYEAACLEVARLRRLDPVSERETELELWSVLLERYEKSAVGAPPPAPAAPAPAAPAKAAASEANQGRPPKIDPWPRFRSPLAKATWGFFFLTGALLYLRLMYQVSYFPPFYEGEESKVLELAKDTVVFAHYTGSWWQAFIGGLIEYNKGFAWALVPFYRVFGYDVRLIMFILPAIFSVLCATYFTIYRKVYPKSSIFSFLAVIVFSLLCLALRRYKWHTVAYITAISVYLYFLPEYYKGAFFLRDRWRKVVAVALFALSFYLYFGCSIYFVPGFFLLVFFSTKLQRRRELAIGLICFVLFAAAFGLVCYTTDRWKVRVGEELRSISEDFSHFGRLKVWWSLRDFLFTLDLSIPYLVFFVLGMITSVKRIRGGDRFALITMAMFLPLWVFQGLIGGLNNPDQTNWSMIPLLGILLTGADQVFMWLRDRLRFGTAVAVVLMALIGWNEILRFPSLASDTPFQSFAHDRNTRAQAALVLRMIRDDDTGSVVYYMPDPSVSEQNGGYDYAASLPRVDYAKAFSKITYFTSEDDLRTKLREQKSPKKAVVYLSVGYPADGEKDTEKMPLLGQDPQIIHPYEDVYHIPYIVRRFEFSPGLAPAAPK